MTMNCDNCNKSICEKMRRIQNDCKKEMFFTLCIQCVNTCSKCGDDIGVAKCKMISDNECTYCGHHSCRSCGINLQCNKQQITVCEECIDNRNNIMCNCLKYKLEGMRKKMRY